jgi:ABC-type Na+ efflux pump permease subunit
MSVFVSDIRRTTRRGRPALLRAGYAAALLVAFGVVFVRWFGIDRLAPRHIFSAGPEMRLNDVAVFARQFALACFVAQFAAVLLITPAFTAGAVAEERQRRTLDDLLITGLSSRAIIFGKLLARWIQIVSVLLAGVPILTLLTLWGGADFPQIILGLFMSELIALVAVSFGLWCSVEMNTVTGAIFAAYCLTLPTLGYGVSMTAMMLGAVLAGQQAFDDRTILMFLIVAGALVLMAVVMSLMAAKRLRLTDLVVVEEIEVIPRRRRRRQPLSKPRPAPFVLPAPPERPAVVPGDDDDPLLWRERNFGSVSGRSGFFPIGAVIGIAAMPLAPLALIMVVAVAVNGTDEPVYRGATRLLMWGPLIALTLGATMSAACSLVRERERQTLDGLLTLPGGRGEILRAKWLGVLGRDRALVITALVPMAAAALLGDFYLLPLFALGIGVVAHLAMCISLGLLASVRGASTTRACVNAAMALLAWCVVPLFLPEPFDMLSPPVLWSRMTDPYFNVLTDGQSVMVACFVAALNGMLAYGVWRLTLDAFNREAIGG